MKLNIKEPASDMVGFATVDLSNLLIEGQRLAAVKNGLARDMADAEHHKILDRRYRISAPRLYKFLAGSGHLKDALVVGSHRAETQPTFAAPFEAAGFRTTFRPLNRHGREKAVDTSVIDVVFEICGRGDPERDDVTHVGGDEDHLPLVEALVNRGYRVDVLAWRHSTSKQLIAAATRFIPLDPYLDFIGFFKE